MVFSLISFSNHHIDGWIEWDQKRWRITGFYGFFESDAHHRSWNLLRKLRGSSDTPWLVGGDFNAILQHAEKFGRRMTVENELDAFRLALEDCSLSDMGLSGDIYTWSNRRPGAKLISERLDRVVCTNTWRLLFPQSEIIHLDYHGFDHRPVGLLLYPTSPLLRPFGNRLSRFEDVWMRYSHCSQIVESGWNSVSGWLDPYQLVQKTGVCMKEQSVWGKSKKGNYGHHIAEASCKVQLAIQNLGMRIDRTKLLEAEDKLEQLLAEEEVFWKQRSREQWLVDGDRNTRWFHSRASYR